MPRPKKASVAPTEKKPVEKKITLTKQQFQTLEEISEAITEARLSIGRFDVENLAEAGFEMGKVYVHIDKIEDRISDLVREIDPDYDDGEDY
jgi:hypothetical protein